MIGSWIIDQLVQQGVHHFCIAPGSRSTPLVLAAIKHPKAVLHTHFDERGLGFFALGIGKTASAAIITTSGTAVGNLLPCVMEASHSYTPLILLTADRPPELKECGANQATDQVKIFQPFVRWQIDLPTEMNESYFRSNLAQAYFYAMKNPPGPVHVNCPFREPFQETHSIQGKPIELIFPTHEIDWYETKKKRGLILVGRLPKHRDIFPILKLAERLDWPVCADILSNARCYPTREQVRYFDWIDKPIPDFVIHFGERMASKRIFEWLKTIRPEVIHVSPWPDLQDPERLLTGKIQVDIAPFCSVFQAGNDPEWFKLWKSEEPIFRETGVFTEAHAMRQISAKLPSDFGVFLGNGMPIRDGDHFLFPKQCRAFFGNRGLSGIDGNIATIAGLSQEMPILGIIGDQATLHDLNSFPLLKKTKYPVILLISNNFGGGVFHHLPIASSPYFEQFWAAAHEFRFEKIGEYFDFPYYPFNSLDQAFEKKETAVVELITNRVQNYQYTIRD